MALVCSAGGLQALISVLRPLPADGRGRSPGKHALVTTGNRLALVSTDHSLLARPSADLLLIFLTRAARRRAAP